MTKLVLLLSLVFLTACFFTSTEAAYVLRRPSRRSEDAENREVPIENGSYTIAAIAGTSTGIFLALILITTCTIFVRCRVHRKMVKILANCWPISTSFNKEFDEIAGEVTEDILDEEFPGEYQSQRNHSIVFNPGASGETEVGIELSGKPCVIQFSLFYNFHDNRLYVHIICALNVPVRWYGRSPDTQVRLQLLPDIDHAYHTEIRINETQPIFNETFEFVGYSARELLELTLRIGFYAFDRFSRGRLLGYTTVPFGELEWHSSKAKILWRTLLSPGTRERTASFMPGFLHVSLRYDAQASRISVIVLKGSSLSKVSRIKILAPYVVVIFQIDGKVLETRSTKRKRSMNPVWNQGFLFDVDSNRIEDYSVIIKVMNYDLLLCDDLIGHIIISARADGSGREHWDRMIQKQHVRREVAMCHELR